jgi:hypothetical protein
MKQAGHGPAPDQGIDVEESARRALCAKKRKKNQIVVQMLQFDLDLKCT